MFITCFWKNIQYACYSSDEHALLDYGRAIHYRQGSSVPEMRVS